MFQTAIILAGSLLLAAGDGPAPPKPDELVRQLGSPKYAEREEASAILVEIGPAALGALERAAKGNSDPEVRSRAIDIRDRIELAMVTRPTMIALDFQDQPLDKVIDAINAQCGGLLSRQPPISPAWSQPITLREPEPLPFWIAIDRLCRAAELQVSYINNGIMGGRGTTLQLSKAAGARPNTRYVGASREGSFLSQIASLNYNRSISLTNGFDPIPNPQSIVNFQAQIQVFAEPRLMISQTGPVRLEEAVDDRGRSLLVSEEETRQMYSHYQYLGQSQLPVSLLLNRPDESSRTIARLRGVVPVQISTRRPEPMEIPLKDSTGKTFTGEVGSITINEIQAPAGQPQTIDLTFTPPGEPAPNDNTFANLHSALQNMVEIVDAKGQQFRWFLKSCTPQMNGSAAIALYVTPNLPGQQQRGAGAEGPPDKLFVYGLKTAPSEVHFDFRDVPMP